MSLFSTFRGLEPNPDPIPESKFKPLGSDTLHDYATFDGREYAVTRRTVSSEEYHRRKGELFVTRKRVELVDGTQWSQTDTHLAMPVAAGAWAKIEKRQQQQAARRNGTDRPMRVWSALGDLFRTGNSNPIPMVLGKVSDDPSSGAMQAATGIGGPLMIEVKPKTLDASPKGLLAYFAAKGIELSRGRRDTSRLVARSRFEISNYDWTLLRRVEPLLVAELGGPKVLCTECSEPAVKPMKPNAWACGEHLS